MITEKDKLLINSLKWYHRIDLGDGIVTPGYSWEKIWDPIEEAIRSVPMDDKSVLDLGCWDGKWTFLAEQLGADVTATDWTGQRWGGKDTFLLAARILNSKATYLPNVDVCRLTEIFQPASFDVVFFMGVLYHTRYPILALSQVRRVLKTGGILVCETHALEDANNSAIYYKYHQAGDADPSNWSIPTNLAFRKMIESSYFEILRTTETPLHGRPAIKEWIKRFVRITPRQHMRSLVVAKAVEREDTGHVWPDSFLSQYDPRFRVTENEPTGRAPSFHETSPCPA